MQVKSYSSRTLTIREHKLSTYYREHCDITFALSKYESNYHWLRILNTFFKIKIFFSLSATEVSHPDNFKAQVVLTKFPYHKNSQFAGSNLTVADMLSQV